MTESKTLTLLALLIIAASLASASPPKYTADYYKINAGHYLNKRAQLYLEDTEFVGEFKGHPGLVQFSSVTWHGVESFGAADILVDAANAQQFYKKYHAEEGHRISNSIGTKTNEGWRARRLSCVFIEHGGKFYFYAGNVSPFFNTSDLVTLTSQDGKSIKCEIVAFRDTKLTVRRSDGKTFKVELTKLSGESQRLVRNWHKAKRRGQ